MKEVLIEVCCGSLDDAIAAKNAGADRIELNSSLFFGGLTPSIGTIIEVKKSIDIPVLVMVRPRGGGFCYTYNELKVMEQDIISSIENGADGIVFGVLKEDGTIDEENCKRLIALCGDKEVVFHRAFDVTPDPFKALDQLISLGVKRVLTKGQENTIEEGEALLKELLEYAKGRIELIPGGCRPYNIEHIVKEIGFNQVHIASFETKRDNSTLAKSHVYFGSALRAPEDSYDVANYSYIKAMHDNIKTMEID